MKQPRIEDFDPQAKEKKLKSSMDSFPAIEQNKNVIQPQSNVSITRTTVPLVPPVRVSNQQARRKIKQRHPFDIYEDQFEELKRLSIEERMQGGIGSMSAMVREALDDFISKKRGK